MIQTGSLPSFNGQPVVLDNDPRLVRVREVEIDVGDIPVDEYEAQVLDDTVTLTSKIFAVMSWDTPTGKDADDVPMDTYVINCGGGVGQLSVRITSIDGRLHDSYRINYIVG